jgi:hypothetical protein
MGRGNRSTWRKPTPVSLCPPQIQHDLLYVRTRAAPHLTFRSGSFPSGLLTNISMHFSTLALPFWSTWSLITLIFVKYCHVSAVCVTYNKGFWIWWSNLLDLYTTWLQQLTIYCLTGHWHLLTTLLLHLNWLHCPPWTIMSYLYNLGADPIENTISKNTRHVNRSVA